MNFEDYRRQAFLYAQYPGYYFNLEYPTLGLCGEAGEIANKVKKISRDNLSMDSVRADIASELGDVLWYAAAVASELGVSLQDIAEANLAKLEDRKQRGVIGGSGDNR